MNSQGREIREPDDRGIGYNRKTEETENRRTRESENQRTGKPDNRKARQPESQRIGKPKDWKVRESENQITGKPQNRKARTNSCASAKEEVNGRKNKDGKTGVIGVDKLVELLEELDCELVVKIDGEEFKVDR